MFVSDVQIRVGDLENFKPSLSEQKVFPLDIKNLNKTLRNSQFLKIKFKKKSNI